MEQHEQGCRIEGYEASAEQAIGSSADELTSLSDDIARSAYRSETAKFCVSEETGVKAFEVSGDNFSEASDGSTEMHSFFVEGRDKNGDGAITREETEFFDLSEGSQEPEVLSDEQLLAWNTKFKDN